MVIGPDGKNYDLPASVAGKDIKSKMAIPENRILTMKKNGGEEVVFPADVIHPQPNDQFDSLVGFSRGSGDC